MNDEQSGVNLPIRMSQKQYDFLTQAAEKSGKKVSTWMREVCITVAGDKRTLLDLLKAMLLGLRK